MIDRRQHRRIITLRNFGWLILVLVFALATVNVVSEFRAPRGNDYGRLSKRETRPDVKVSPQTPEVVQEGPTPGYVSNPATEQPLATEQPSNPPVAAVPPQPVNANIVAIVGDSSGVTVITPKRKLRGGFPER